MALHTAHQRRPQFAQMVWVFTVRLLRPAPGGGEGDQTIATGAEEDE